MFWTKAVEKIKTHILCSITLIRNLCRLWDNVEKYGGARGATNHVTMWRIRVAWWISKAIRTPARAHTEINITLIDFSRQQWFRERAAMLRYTYTAETCRSIKIYNKYKKNCLSCFSKFLSMYTNSSLSEYVDKNLGSTQVFCSGGRSVNEFSSTRKEDALYQSLRSYPPCISDRFITQPSSFHQWHSAGCLFHCVVFVFQLVLYFSTSLLFRVWL